MYLYDDLLINFAVLNYDEGFYGSDNMLFYEEFGKGIFIERRKLYVNEV